ncbi:hypothetical protein DSO57_1008829 [Entomophthora muscae]|uniref:Uncharacterized protein n=1 Tax=Entomophthora muscae TaxID=34485 RepID=A0ACC2RLR5_9FUNG|nr:hypothetical protein DSO57_1008829 [Entomophthora muscae]
MASTSMAAPHVVGLAAIVLSKNKNLTPANVKRKIMDHTTQHVKTKDGKETQNKLASSIGL